MNTQDWSPLAWTGWISLQSKGLLRVVSNTSVQKHQFFGAQLYRVQLSHPYMITGETIALTRWTFVSKVMSLLFNMLSRLFIAFLPRSKRLLISWRQSLSAVILEPKKIKSVTVSNVSSSLCHEGMWPEAMMLVFWMLSLKPAFSLSSFTFIKRLFSFSLLSAISRVTSVKWFHLSVLFFQPGLGSGVRITQRADSIGRSSHPHSLSSLPREWWVQVCSRSVCTGSQADGC